MKGSYYQWSSLDDKFSSQYVSTELLAEIVPTDSSGGQLVRHTDSAGILILHWKYFFKQQQKQALLWKEQVPCSSDSEGIPVRNSISKTLERQEAAEMSIPEEHKVLGLQWRKSSRTQFVRWFTRSRHCSVLQRCWLLSLWVINYMLQWLLPVVLQVLFSNLLSI